MIVDELVTVTIGRGRLPLGSWRLRLAPAEHADVVVGQRWPNHRRVPTGYIARPRLTDIIHPPATLGAATEVVIVTGEDGRTELVQRTKGHIDSVLEYTAHVRRVRDARRFVADLKAAGYR